MQKFVNRYIILIGLMFISSLAIFWLQVKQPKNKTDVDISKIPLTIAEWWGEEIPVDKQTKDILETDSVLMRRYTNSKGDSIVLAIVYYKDSRIAFHLPESCLLGHGSRLTDRETEKIDLPNGQSFYTTKLRIKNRIEDNIILYYFETGDLKSKSYVVFRWKILLNKLKGKNSSGALVRFSIGTQKNDLQSKLFTLKKFISVISQILLKYLI